MVGRTIWGDGGPPARRIRRLHGHREELARVSRDVQHAPGPIRERRGAHFRSSASCARTFICACSSALRSPPIVAPFVRHALTSARGGIGPRMLGMRKTHVAPLSTPGRRTYAPPQGLSKPWYAPGYTVIATS